MPVTVVTLGEPVRGSSIEVQNGVSSTFFCANVGSGNGVFQNITAGVANFKSLIASTGITMANNTNDITISVNSAYITSLVNIGPVGYTVDRAIISNSTTGALIVSTVTAAELSYLSGVTSGIQAQLNTKQVTITGGATTITTANLGFNFALVSDGAGKVVVSATTATEISYISGLTSSAQTQINTKVNKAGDTMTGALAMSGFKITGLAAATSNGDAVRYEQLFGVSAWVGPITLINGWTGSVYYRTDVSGKVHLRGAVIATTATNVRLCNNAVIPTPISQGEACVPKDSSNGQSNVIILSGGALQVDAYVAADALYLDNVSYWTV